MGIWNFCGIIWKNSVNIPEKNNSITLPYTVRGLIFTGKLFKKLRVTNYLTTSKKPIEFSPNYTKLLPVGIEPGTSWQLGLTWQVLIEGYII